MGGKHDFHFLLLQKPILHSLFRKLQYISEIFRNLSNIYLNFIFAMRKERILKRSEPVKLF